MKRHLALLVTLVMLTAACNQAPDEASEEDETGAAIAIVSPEDGSSQSGDTVTLEIELTGIQIVAADGDTSGETGHLHVFIDTDPVGPGEIIPETENIIHSTETTIVIGGLEPGLHSFVVVPGDGTHARIGALSARIEVVLEG